MEDLKDLVLDYRRFITNVLISNSELFSNYYELRLTSEEQQSENVEKIIENKIIKDILYDFIYDIEKIKLELANAQDFLEEEYSKNETLKIYKEIKKVFKDFYIKELED